MRCRLVIAAAAFSVTMATMGILEAVATCLCERPDVDVGLVVRIDGRDARMCSCHRAVVEQINTVHVLPALRELLQTRFFRHFQLQQLPPDCPSDAVDELLFTDALDNTDDLEQPMCAIRECAIEKVDAAIEQTLRDAYELMTPVQAPTSHASTGKRKWQSLCPNHGSDVAARRGRPWIAPLSGDPADFVFYDLEHNNERFTGYSGEDVQRLWRTIHRVASHVSDKDDTVASTVGDAVSGLHTSIASHIAKHHLLNSTITLWGFNLDVYKDRVLRHPGWIDNLVHAYLIVLRSVAVSADWLEGYPIWSGNATADVASVAALTRLLSVRHQWPIMTFDHEMSLHRLRMRDPRDAAADAVLRERMHTLSLLSECIGCERCRLWGRLQFEGIATAFHILTDPCFASTEPARLPPRQVVALLNTLGRLAESVDVLATARSLLNA